MAAPGIPQNFHVQTANGTNLVSWSLSTGATSYTVQRSLDNVTYSDLTTISGSPLATSYLDTAVTIGTQYWYKVKSVNADGSSSYTIAQAAVPYTSGEMNLAAIRLAAQQRADKVNSNFVTMPEWNNYINQAMFELYDLLTTTYEDYFISPVPVMIQTDGTTFIYPLPNGTNTFLDGLSPGSTITPPAFYKLLGVDIGLNTSGNGFATVNKFNFIDRNRYAYPTQNVMVNTPLNLNYRVMGSNIQFIPTPTANQFIRLWYIPRLTELLQDTDITTMGISGWLEYVIVRAAKYVLDKEESDTTKLDQQIVFLKARIEESASNRDAGQPDTISDTRRSNGGHGNGWGGF